MTVQLDDYMRQIAGNPLLVGFHTELEVSSAALKRLKGRPKANFRCVKRARYIVGLLGQILPMVTDNVGE